MSFLHTKAYNIKYTNLQRQHSCDNVCSYSRSPIAATALLGQRRPTASYSVWALKTCMTSSMKNTRIELLM